MKNDEVDLRGLKITAFSLLARKPDEARKEARASAAPSTDEAAERRQKFIEGCDATLKQINEGEEKPNRGWYFLENGGVSIRPKVGRKVMRVFASGEKGDLFDFVPVVDEQKPLDVARDYFTSLKEMAEAEQIDSWLMATLNGDRVPHARGGKPKLDSDQ